MWEKTHIVARTKAVVNICSKGLHAAPHTKTSLNASNTPRLYGCSTTWYSRLLQFFSCHPFNPEGICFYQLYLFCALHKGSRLIADGVQMCKKGRKGPKMVRKKTKASCFSHAGLAIGCHWTMIWILRTSTLRPCAVRAALSTVKMRTKRRNTASILLYDVEAGFSKGTAFGLSRGLLGIPKVTNSGRSP
ncbi:uncharacterized protein ARMOST_14199 [Armillaria ostoyae]|uniref:Uncharacterized protein n=1 Tax=Armillaria ostoyae TaxID=47428 RepID=A0A284RQ42_ARMOS|nr:uncharacterized protein ARMOST_14199 [Armillaria ostoyae]